MKWPNRGGSGYSATSLYFECATAYGFERFPGEPESVEERAVVDAAKYALGPLQNDPLTCSALLVGLEADPRRLSAEMRRTLREILTRALTAIMQMRSACVAAGLKPPACASPAPCKTALARLSLADKTAVEEKQS